MAATVQSDHLQLLIRKIGYSVGLAKTFDRVLDLASAYVAAGDISYGAWSELVRGWGLETEHIGDVFRSLNLIEIRQKRTFVLPGLDVLGVCCRALGSPESLRQAGELVLSGLVIEADADIFLNCLAGEFDREVVATLLAAMVRYKREKLFGIYKMPELRRRIAHVVNIEAQTSNPGGANVGRGLSAQRPGLKRPASEILRTTVTQGVTISDDYLRKVPPTRREWAKSVRLCDEEGKTSIRGKRLLENFEKAGFRTPDGAYFLWPLANEFSILRLKPEALATQAMTYWDFLTHLASAFGQELLPKADESGDADAVAKLRQIFQLYQTVNPHRSMLRKELPTNIGYTTYMALAFVSGEAVPWLPAVVDRQRRAPAAAIDFRTSRLHEGSLLFRS